MAISGVKGSEQKAYMKGTSPGEDALSMLGQGATREQRFELWLPGTLGFDAITSSLI